MFIIDHISLGKQIVKVPKMLITAILIFLTSMLLVSCRTCKCPAYSINEIHRNNISNVSEYPVFLFDKRLPNAKTVINQSI